MGKKGETLVEVRLFDSARFYKTSSSAWSQEDVNQEPQVDDREWANWDDEEWAATDEEEDEDGGGDCAERESAAHDDAANSTAVICPPLSLASTARDSPAAEEPQEPESRRKLLVGATPGRPGRPHRERYSELPSPVIPSVPHGGEGSGWGAPYNDLPIASPARGSAVSTPNETGRGHSQPMVSPRPPLPHAPDHKPPHGDGRPLPAHPQPRIRSRGRYLGSAGGMGLPVRSRGSDKGVENRTPTVRLSPSPASAPALDTGELADMLTTVSPRADPANSSPRKGADGTLAGMGGRDDHDEFLPAIHGTKMSQLSQKLAPQQFHPASSEAVVTQRRATEAVSSGSRRRSKLVWRSSDEPHQHLDNHGRGHGHVHGGWGRRPHDDALHGEQDQIRLPSLSSGLVVMNAARRAGGEGDVTAAHENVNAPRGGPTGNTSKRRHHHQHRRRRHSRGYRGGSRVDDTHGAILAVVSRRQVGEREPPPVLVTAASQLQQNVMRQIENDNPGLRPIAASGSRSEARKQRQQLRLTRGLP